MRREVSTSPDILERLLRPPAGDDAIDRKALAGLLVEIAQSLKPELRAQQNGVHPGDLQLEQLRTLLVGREIETLSRLAGMVDDPERLAAVIGNVLPTAIAQATSDMRMGHVLAPVMEKAAESSIRNDPKTLINILYPTIVPAIRKSIGETIDETFQRLNQTLKYSLTWRGLKWRWEAWRTGSSFAEVVLKHTLVYQVEHVFLVHRHTGLLIAHVAAENAVSQDPQLVSSMLVAIQDFVRDSFSGAEHQGVDSVQLGICGYGPSRDRLPRWSRLSAAIRRRGCTMRCAIHCRGFMPSDIMRSKASTATAPVSATSRQACANWWRLARMSRRAPGWDV